MTLRRLLSLQVVLTVLFTVACSRQPALQPDRPLQQLPFDRQSEKGGISPTAAFTNGEIPAGTLIAIRLQGTVSSATGRSGETFNGVLDEPLVVRGQTVAEAGAPVSGKVLEAKPSRGNEPGYLRLTMTEVSLNRKPVPIETAVFFAKGGARESRDASSQARASQRDVSLSSGRRLTFRLTQAIVVTL